MAPDIEKTNRLRKNILRGIFIATAIAFVWFMLPYLGIGLFRSTILSANRAFVVARNFWLFSLLAFGLIHWLFKQNLKKHHDVYEAVYDDRTKLSWLKAYRVAFFVAFIVSALWKLYESSNSSKLLTFKVRTLPNGPFLILYIAVISLLGSFLFLNREVKNG